MKVIYPDVLFLINFIIDYVLLRLTAYLRGNVSSRKRLVLAAVIGGVLAAALFFAPTKALMSIVMKGVCCGLMTLTAFGFADKRRFFGDCFMLCAASFIISGGVVAVSQIFPMAGTIHNTSVYFNISLRDLIFGAAVGYFVITLLCGRGSMREEKNIKEIKCNLRGADLAFNAFVDTGNMLTDPANGKKIIVLSRSLAAVALPGEEGKIISSMTRDDDISKVFGRLAVCSPVRYGLAPFSSAGGGGLMITVKPERLEIDGKPSEDYIIGIGTGEMTPVCGCRAVIGC